MVRPCNYNQIMNVTSSLVGINSFLIHILPLVTFSNMTFVAGLDSLVSCEVFPKVFLNQ